MKPLREIQELFSNAVFATETDSTAVAAFTPLIRSTEKLNAVERVEIYSGSVFANLTDALRATYIVCLKLIGEPTFRALAQTYIKRYPSTGQNLNYYGGEFAGLIEELSADFPNLSDKPYLADLARLEWQFDQIFYSQDDAPSDWTALAKIPVEQQGELHFKLSHSARLMTSAYPLLAIWQAQQEVNDPIDGSEEVPQHLLISRSGNTRQIELLEKPQWQFLKALQQYGTFNEVCDSFLDSKAVEDDVSVDVVALLPESIQRGWVVGFELA